MLHESEFTTNATLSHRLELVLQHLYAVNYISILIALFSLLTGCRGEFPEGAMSQSAGGTATPTDAQGNVVISIAANSFGVNPLIVRLGTNVIWRNDDSVSHSIVSTTNLFQSGEIAPGQRFSFTFNQTGNFAYFCQIHGSTNESGTIQVVAIPTEFPTPIATPTPTPIFTLTETF